MLHLFLLAATVLICAQATAVEIQTSKVSERSNPMLCATGGDGMVLNRADRTITLCDPNGTQRTSYILDAQLADGHAVERDRSEEQTVPSARLDTVIQRQGGKITLTPNAVQQPANDNPFWLSESGAGRVNRLTGRLLFGAAAANDGIYYGTSCGRTIGCINGFTSKDWLSQLARESWNGGAGVGEGGGSDANFAQMTVLFDGNSPLGTMAVPQIAFLAAVQTRNSPTNGTPRAISAFGVNNNPDNTRSPSVWAFYPEAHRKYAWSGNTYAIEAEVRNSGSEQQENPYFQSGKGSFVYEAGCGAGLPATGQFACTNAFYITKNPMPFLTGINFLDGSIKGIGGIYAAIRMPQDYRVEWWKSSGPGAGQRTASIRADQSGNLIAETETSGMLVTNGGTAIGDGSGLYFGSPYSATSIGGTSTGKYLTFQTSSTERVRITDKGLKVTGMPTSPSGLPSGSLWRDASAGNVVKIVP